MPVILRVEAISDGNGGYHWLKHRAYISQFDVDAYDGRGHVETTADPNKAYQWPTAKDAMHDWNTQSSKRPLRADGKPNKPLTAMTVEIVEHDKAAKIHRV